MIMSPAKIAAMWIADTGIVAVASTLALFGYPVFHTIIPAMWTPFGRSVWSVYLPEMLSVFIFGAILGAVTAWALRRRSLVMAVLPAIILCCVYVSYGYFGPIKYKPIPIGSRADVIDLAEWLMILAAAFWSARLVLRRRESL